jgi:glycerol-3-phosphate dehydrogenase
MLREEMLQRLEDRQPWDLIIIGGGATGLGSAVDAATRGYRTLLLEAHDFAKGTSSRSTKLVHGGVRYLAQGRIMLVRQALRERGLLNRNASHLVRRMPFIIPAYHTGSRLYYGTGMKLYDVLAGRLGIGKSALLSREEVLRRTPTVRSQDLRGGVLYYDGQFDDARLAIALMRTFLHHGGTAINYAPVTGLLKANGRIAGVAARDEESGQTFELHARAVLNATGVFADQVGRMDNPAAAPLLVPSQGAHLVLDRSFLPGDSAVMIPRTDDGRVLFAIPWQGKVVVGTTDVPVASVSVEPRPLDEEIEFLLSHAGRYLDRPVEAKDVLSIFAGLRPLVRSGNTDRTASVSRDHTIVVSASGLVTITGGKWTTYRHMAADAVTESAHVADLPGRPCRTADLPLHGSSPSSPSPGTPGEGWGGGPVEAPPHHHPHASYGTDAPTVMDLCRQRPQWQQPLHPRLPYLAGEVVWAARHEMARTVEDVLSRRTRALLLDARAAIESAPLAAELLSAELDRNAEWAARQIGHFQALARAYLPAETAFADVNLLIEQT